MTELGAPDSKRRLEAMSPVRRALQSPEEEPLHRHLEDGFEESDVLQRFRSIDRRLARTPSLWPRAAAAVALAAALILVAWFGLRRPTSEPLALLGGALPTLIEAQATAREARFADGSVLELAKDTRLEILRNDGHAFVSVLRRGSGTFDVEPGGPRHWIIETGLASVEVVGTRFTVTRGADRVRVSVEHGIVVVRAESLPGTTRRLGAGESVEVLAPTPAAPERERGPAPAPVVSPPPASSAPSPVASTPRLAPSNRVEQPLADEIDARLSAADAARRRGDRESAIRHLEEVLEQATPDDPRRGMAALSLARLTVRQDPALAATALEGSMQGMPKGLAEDALARRVEAEARAGNRARASELAKEYLERFPNGHRANDVRRWLDP
jgi:transmembrane sensor